MLFGCVVTNAITSEMTSRRSSAGPPETGHPSLARTIHRLIVIAVAVVMTIDLGFIMYDAQWLNAFLILMIMAMILAPTLLGERLPVVIPAEFHILSMIFAFAALFLGEVRSYYERFWWWDLALHGSSGLLLGFLGFLLVYALNENRRVDLHVRPFFVALFAFLFAVTVGTLWEIFEFAIDRLLGMNMQKPMFGDPSGLTDTMWDLILNVIGALAISSFGWWYMKRQQQSFIERWISKFIAGNPGLFRH